MLLQSLCHNPLPCPSLLPLPSPQSPLPCSHTLAAQLHVLSVYQAEQVFALVSAGVVSTGMLSIGMLSSSAVSLFCGACRYAELLYNGFWFSPEREALQAAIDSSQKFVSGTVRLKLYKVCLSLLLCS